MEIKDALGMAQRKAGWSDEQVAVAANTTAASVKRWKTGESVPRGDAVVALQRSLPGFRELTLKEAVA